MIYSNAKVSYTLSSFSLLYVFCSKTYTGIEKKKPHSSRRRISVAFGLIKQTHIGIK